jgi:protein Mpv17
MATGLALARAYQQSFDAYPNRTLALAGGVLNAMGDALAQFSTGLACPRLFSRRIPALLTARSQFLQEENQRKGGGYDFARTLRFFCFGMTISRVPASKAQ